ncbi:hypothetical protein RFI_20630 [Reticulomyxa filosa]|uniref:Uncharacterized protein n=1 Tax=Reticulomyxa filosa TaxID=46433 RepID=X6MUB3_RETFI|nr:hypothetical protein RFI_20630 [Reticulomyxa filosa]|eukprot:ETO16710.1 hypothetical protein RFI_20630 [Reticulomyxa filosa]
MNNIGVIGGNGYTICSGPWDKTIRIWDIETAKQLSVFKGHKVNTILSGSQDNSIRLWDIRSGQQSQVFNGHTSVIWSVGYSPFVVNNIEVGGNSNVICSGSVGETIRFWDIRSNKNELYVMKDDISLCLKFMELKKKVNNNKQKSNDNCVNLYYGSIKGPIYILTKVCFDFHFNLFNLIKNYDNELKTKAIHIN